jgi:hypothetical protein
MERLGLCAFNERKVMRGIFGFSDSEFSRLVRNAEGTINFARPADCLEMVRPN